MEGRNEIVLFETKDKAICLPVPIDRDTVWLTQDQMSELFDTARSSIAYHIGKIFKEGELQRDTSVEIFDRNVIYTSSVKCSLSEFQGHLPLIKGRTR